MLRKLLTKEELTHEILKRQQLAEQTKLTEFLAARKIQANYRGYLCRKTIQKWNKSATAIQRIYRGFIGRKLAFQVLEEKVQFTIQEFYNSRATLIQKCYRGFYSRKYTFDYYKLKLWLKQIVLKNEQLEEETWKYFFEQRNKKLEEINAVAKKLCIFIAKKLHHLLRTHQLAGIYSDAETTALTNIERLLASFTYQKFNKEMAIVKETQKTKYIAAVDKCYEKSQIPKTKYSRCDAHYRYRDIDTAEEAMRERSKAVSGTAVRCGPIRRPYVKLMLASEKFCGNIIEMTRKFEILAPGRDFCLNTHIVRKPERIQQFIEVLHNFCLLHNIIEK